MTPDDVAKAADLLEQWRTHQAQLVNWSQAPIAVWADGRALTVPGLSDAVRGILMDVATSQMQGVVMALKDLGVEAPVMAEEARAAVAAPRVEGTLFTAQTAMAVIEDDGRTKENPLPTEPMAPGLGNDHLPGGQQT